MSFRMWVEAKLGVEAADQVLGGIRSIMVNLFYRTRPFKPNGPLKTTSDYLRYYTDRMKLVRDWVERNQGDFPVPQQNMKIAIDAMGDAVISLHYNPEPDFVAAQYHKGADPKSAETLDQFSKFLHKRMDQKPVAHPLLTKAGEAWEQFHNDFVRTMKQTLQ